MLYYSKTPTTRLMEVWIKTDKKLKKKLEQNKDTKSIKSRHLLLKKLTHYSCDSTLSIWSTVFWVDTEL